MIICSVPGRRRGAIEPEGGDATPHGAENSALKNRAPLNFTALNISEMASMASLQETPESRQTNLPFRAPEQEPRTYGHGQSMDVRPIITLAHLEVVNAAAYRTSQINCLKKEN
jgi:hypothetical protein